ncbi:hypothetical protein EYF80_057080 [Liparis tanakae]|uniref:Uncharacterized protein n=1 Tax=Liparis tanakae TaxID=230148 RepID=A0A4Z2EUZ1_9TELE|nr:hypothetical protein EYF80_057080 [Liparis tanakae]
MWTPPVHNMWTPPLNADVATTKLHFYIDIVKTRPLVVFLLYIGFLGVRAKDFPWGPETPRDSSGRNQQEEADGLIESDKDWTRPGSPGVL